MLKIGQNLKKARIQAGLTQKEVEARLSLRDLMMKDYETERIKLPVEMAARLAELYNLSLAELISAEDASEDGAPQNNQLGQISTLFHHSYIKSMNQDAVIRAYLEEFLEQVLDHSFFELMTMSMNQKEKSELSGEIVRTLGSLMGADKKVTDHERSFFSSLIIQLGIDSQGRSISRSLTIKHLPRLEAFMNRPAAKHFLLWLMFFLANSDSEITKEEVDYIQECAEVLKVNRTNYLQIKKNFVKEKF